MEKIASKVMFYQATMPVRMVGRLIDLPDYCLAGGHNDPPLFVYDTDDHHYIRFFNARKLTNGVGNSLFLLELVSGPEPCPMESLLPVSPKSVVYTTQTEE